MGGKEGHKERRRSPPGGCRRTKRRGMAPLSAWGQSEGGPSGRKELPGSRSVFLDTQSHHLRPGGSHALSLRIGGSSPALSDGWPCAGKRMGPVAEAGSAHLPHVTSRRRSGTGASEGKGGEKLFLSLLFCSLGVLNIRRGGSAGSAGHGRQGFCRRKGAGLAGLRGRGLR